MRKKAFTIMEVLLAMGIIGILAAATINAMGKMQANKTKVAFENCYRHMVETTNSLIADETNFPVILKEGPVLESGHSFNWRIRLIPDTEQGENEGNISGSGFGSGLGSGGSTLFPRLFKDATNTVSWEKEHNGYSFISKNGSAWYVGYNPETKTNMSLVDTADTLIDYFIIFDVNGFSEGSNCPYTGSTFTTDDSSNCTHPDTFKFGLTMRNSLRYDDKQVYDGKDLKTYLNDAGFTNINNVK